jgi:hypothetical protein
MLCSDNVQTTTVVCPSHKSECRPEPKTPCLHQLSLPLDRRHGVRNTNMLLSVGNCCFVRARAHIHGTSVVHVDISTTTCW